MKVICCLYVLKKLFWLSKCPFYFDTVIPLTWHVSENHVSQIHRFRFNYLSNSDKLCMHIFFDYYVPYALLWSPWLICNNQFVLLNPYTFFSHSPDYSPMGNHQNSLCIYDSVSVLLAYLFCFLYSIVDRYAFISILLSYFWSPSS